MVEDALKSTRNLQRVLLAVGLVAFVFLASLTDTAPEVGALRRGYLQPKTYELLARPLRIGRIHLEEVFEPDRRDVTLSQLREELWDLPLDRPVEITGVEISPDQLADLRRFFSPGPDAPLPVNSRPEILDLAVSLDLPSPQRAGHSFLPPDRTFRGELSFMARWQPAEVPGASGEQEAATVERRFRASLLSQQTSIPETSWQEWWTRVAELPPLEDPSQWEASVEPPLDPGQPLPALEDELVRRLSLARAASRSISFVGVSMPGSLALFGVPIVLVGLLVSLFLHLRHLHHLVDRHREEFQDFLWTALAPGWMGLIEPWVAAFLLPVAIHGLLLLRAVAFADVWLARSVALLGFILVAETGLNVLRSIWRLRRRLDR